MAFFVKQNGLILVASSIPYFLLKRKFKASLFQLILLTGTFLFYYILFPRTKEMGSKDFIFSNLSDINYVFSLIYGILLITVSFIIPICLYLLITTLIKNIKKIHVLLLIGVMSLILFQKLNHEYKPGKISWEEFPYFENTFERTGFLPRTVLGTKYQFRMNYDLYKYWDIASKVVLAVLLSCLLFKYKKLINIYSITIIAYLILMIFVSKFFDRYILMLIPFAILFVLELQRDEMPFNYKIIEFMVFPFVIFTGFFSLQLTADFIFSHNYIWSKSREIINKKNIDPKYIRATGAWTKVYKNTNSDYYFIFSYDDFVKNPDLKPAYGLYDTHEVKYPLNIFIDPKVYLYKRRDI
jgi:hypothetical protein